MKSLLILAGVASLGWISVSTDPAMDRCLVKASFQTCHHALNR